ncbi:60S ribosomal protein L21A [Dimargaris xerosporica]|nr:60S ribosomal protein L21A [Dimargaris xerosporica]
MPHSFGYRARTRKMFSRNFREHGQIRTSTYLQTYKVGDLVDIVANSAQQKGMPHKYYHGKTGVVFNVTKSALGVMVYKRVRTRYMEKKVSVRIEHVNHSKCRDEFLRRCRENHQKNVEAKAAGQKAVCKRQPAQPREGHVVEVADAKPLTIQPIPYDTLI